MTNPAWTCPVCRRVVEVVRDRDGYGRHVGPLRFVPHTGSGWGRLCKGGGEPMPESKPRVPADP